MSVATRLKYNFKKKRCKLLFIASDGTEESKMIAFAAVAQNIVGKPVETVMRSSRNRDNIPPDIAAIVSSKFTFSVTMAESSFHKPKKSYQVNSILHSYGKQRVLSFHAPNQAQLLNENAQLPGQPSGSASPSHIPPGSSQNPLHETPTKILPLEQMLLQTPMKTTELPKSNQGNDNIM